MQQFTTRAGLTASTHRWQFTCRAERWSCNIQWCTS